MLYRFGNHRRRRACDYWFYDSKWRECRDTNYVLQLLKQRGLNGTQLVISDAHPGLVTAIRQSFAGIYWQRCQVHFMRNILETIPKKESNPFRDSLKAVFRFTTIDLARAAKDQLLQAYEGKKNYQKACEKLDRGFEETFQYAVMEQVHSRLKSTNLIERLNQEVRRCEKIIRIFPNVASTNRLVGAVLMDEREEWISSSRNYIQF